MQDTDFIAQAPNYVGGTWTLRRNDYGWTCDWCEDRNMPAPFIVADDNGRGDEFENAACVAHVLRHHPGLWPEGKRPAEYGRTFMLRTMIRNSDYEGMTDWEYYDRSDEMFNQSQFMISNRYDTGWVLVSRSSNAHYRRTGHCRLAYRNRYTGATVTVHAVVR